MNVLVFGYWQVLLIRLFRRHPLVRGCDRAEAMVQLLGWLSVLVMLSVAGAAGTALYDAGSRSSSEQLHSRHQVQAVAIGESHAVAPRYSAVVLVPARWNVGAVEHHDTVRYGADLNTGDRFPIWVDSTGRSVSAPTSRTDAAADAIVGAVLLWTAVTSLVVGAVGWTLRRIQRIRYARWESDFDALVDRGGRRKSDH
ncbi:hypothetical protein [Mycobacteroides franklinii]|uniref:Putative membrane protein n=1 Tax=Mycobacteroides franklinii TaxID=948102 RepID=A0A4R8QYR3_9MYCO|nr:hypothetical protein [Mycobacteroides franklinii]TDH20195.1 hypothetical protein EJ571_15490 [Mycobacteroides franklinii]TDZ45213.1 putative membrane protein [Mycobacteroides franklinii]TDZ48704.1 putative membrane protein [Mycobacteroides franklinii]TDZ58885.1 putative membrane protein [Mycobacteroides franklinii]TDZ66399.1 putative membrane protein [Mycobacteroides franklinii]